MKILWLCNIILPKVASHIGIANTIYGGWITGCATALAKKEDVQLSVCFPYNNELNGSVDNLEYYSFIREKKSSKKTENRFIDILNQVKPDVIQVWGTEYYHSLSMVRACEETNNIDKLAISIQGLSSICAKHYFACLPQKTINSWTLRDFIKRDNLKLQKRKFYKSGKREIEAIKSVKNIIGRTDWDRACSEQINSSAKYYFCNEILRDEFYCNESWTLENCEAHSIFFSQGSYPIKGLHNMLEAMQIIKQFYPKVKINIAGANILDKSSLKQKLKMSSYAVYLQKLIKKYKLEDSVVFLGNLNELQMKKAYLSSHVFVCASSVENESNSLSEAKMLGVPCVVSFAGGMTNRIRHKIDGYLYQHDAPYMLAYYICQIFENEKIAKSFSIEAKRSAESIHDREKNIAKTLEIYQEIISANSK